MLRRTRGPCQALFALLVVLLPLFACGPRSGPQPPNGPALEDQVGTIRKVGTFGFGIVPDRDPGTRLAPDRLPAEFAVDGLRVIYRGIETSPLPDSRLWGIPFQLVAIRRAP